MYFSVLQVANVGPADYNYDESVSTLRYANRAKNIKNKARINEDPKDALLRQYQSEIDKLKKLLEEGGNLGGKKIFLVSLCLQVSSDPSDFCSDVIYMFLYNYLYVCVLFFIVWCYLVNFSGIHSVAVICFGFFVDRFGRWRI